MCSARGKRIVKRDQDASCRAGYRQHPCIRPQLGGRSIANRLGAEDSVRLLMIIDKDDPIIGEQTVVDLPCSI